MFIFISSHLIFFSCNHEIDNLDNNGNTDVSSEEIEKKLEMSPIEKKQPLSRCGESVVLECRSKIQDSNRTVSYQWYTSSDSNIDNRTIIDNETTSKFTTESFTEKGIHYYYCQVRETITKEDGTNTELTKFIPFFHCYTGLPIVQIDTVDGEEPTAEYVSAPYGSYGTGLKNATKVKSRLRILKDGIESPVYDSGEFLKDESGLTIKLRGNTSAYFEKKPYKLKLQKKADLLATLLSGRDNSYKHKEWILLKDGTSLNTFVGMAVADIAGTLWTPEFAFVNVVLNGDYRGIYLLIEAISTGDKRENVSKNGYIIERDAYWWNEDVKFITTLYNQKFTFKYPDDDKITDDQLNYIKNYMNCLEQHVEDGTYEDYIDVDSFARWLLIHDILGSWDSAGSNIYMAKYDNTEDSKIYMSTPWDYDSNFWMPGQWSNQHGDSRMYACYLMQSENTAFKNSYKSQWNTISSSIWSDLSTKLDELNETLGNDINLSRKADAIRFGDKVISVEDDIETVTTWFSTRITWLDSAIGEL